MASLVFDGESRLPGGGRIVALMTGLYRPSSNAKTGPMAQLWILSARSNPYQAQVSGHDSAVCGDCPLRPILAARTPSSGYLDADDAHRMGWRTFRISDGEAPLRREIVCPASEESGRRTTCRRCRLCNGHVEGDGLKSIVIKRHGLAGQEERCYVNTLHAPRSIWTAWHSGAAKPMRERDWDKLRTMAVRLGAYGDPAALPYELVDRIASTARAWTGYTHAWRYCDQRFRSLLMASV